MKLLYLAGANSIHSYRWINYFVRAGHEIIWISFAPAIAPIDPKIRYYEFRSRLPRPFDAFMLMRPIRRIIHAETPDLMHAHSAGLYGFVACLVGFHPFLLTAWGSDVLVNPRKFMTRFIVKKILAVADLITSDGDNTTTAMIRLGAKPGKIQRILFGTDTEKFKPRPSTEKTGAPRIISLRSLEPLYDIEALLRAARIVLGPIPYAEFVIAGDGSERSRLEALAKELGIAEQTRFIGKLSGDEIPRALAETDIYVSTALSDSGLASSTAEAMASGLPVVVTDSGDNKKWIEENKGGFVVPCRDPEALAQKIIFLLTHEKERYQFGAYNRHIIEQRNNYSREMAKMDMLYRQFAPHR